MSKEKQEDIKPKRRLVDIEVKEVSLVPKAANRWKFLVVKNDKETGDKDIETEKGSIPYSSFAPARENQVWDGDLAVQRLREMSSADGSGDKDKMNWERYRRFFLWFDERDAENFGSYKMPVVDILDRQPKVVFNAVVAALAAMRGARSGVNIPEDDKPAIMSRLRRHYDDFGKEFPEEKAKTETDMSEENKNEEVVEEQVIEEQVNEEQESEKTEDPQVEEVASDEESEEVVEEKGEEETANKNARQFAEQMMGLFQMYEMNPEEMKMYLKQLAGVDTPVEDGMHEEKQKEQEESTEKTATLPASAEERLQNVENMLRNMSETFTDLKVRFSESGTLEIDAETVIEEQQAAASAEKQPEITPDPKEEEPTSEDIRWGSDLAAEAQAEALLAEKKKSAELKKAKFKRASKIKENNFSWNNLKDGEPVR